MPIQIYNSLTKTKEELKPLDGNTIRIYSCGVTVYDKCHIGHARSLYVFEVLRRYLKHRGYNVFFVRNITDVDDKIINKSKELGKSFEEVVEENIAAYERDLENLGVDKADKEPRATQYIPQMIDFIKQLIDKEYAYEVEGNVYYSVRKFADYGKLSGQSADQMLEATRIEQDPYKKDSLDFALWKKAKEGEPFWESPWGGGRPGWHIECSCMSLNELDCQTLDIHAGGRDLIFPHHENEIAQSEALTGKPFANMWIHHGLLTIDGQKMAKSLNNFITLDEVLERYSSDVLKLFYLQSHYQSPVDFSWEKMEETKKALQKLEIFFKESDMMQGDNNASQEDPEFLKNFENTFKTAMDDDLNTPEALAALYELLNDTYKMKDKESYAGVLHKVHKKVLIIVKEVFGLFVSGQEEVIDETIEKLIDEREEARKNKDFKRSDELRDELLERNIIIEDTPQGQRWRKA